MLGQTPSRTSPTVVIVCLNQGIAKRLGQLVKKDNHFQRSGFDLLGWKGCLRFAAGDLKGRESTDNQIALSHKDFGLFRRNIFGAAILTVPVLGDDEDQSPIIPTNKEQISTIATMGGVIEIGGELYGLTVAHSFLGRQATPPMQVNPLASDEHLETDALHDLQCYSLDDDDGEIGLSPDELQESQSAKPLLLEERRVYLLGDSKVSGERNSEFSASSIKPDMSQKIGVFRNPRSTSPTGTNGQQLSKTPYACLDLDWALVTIDEQQVQRINQVDWAGRRIVTTKPANDPPIGEVLVISDYCGYHSASSSGTVSLISLPGAETLERAYTMNCSCGEYL